MHQGWIKMFRKLDEWEWYTDSKMVHLFLHLVLRAQHKPVKYRGIDLDRGQLLTGRNLLSKETGISVRSIRTCLNHLKSTNEVTIKATKSFSIITIVNYDTYQSRESQADQANDQVSDHQPTKHRPSTDHMQEAKKEKNEKKPIGEVAEYWNSQEKLPKVRSITGKRQAHLKARLNESLFVESWRMVIDALCEIPGMLGQNDRGWKVDFDWLIANDTNYVKVLEGKYDAWGLVQTPQKPIKGLIPFKTCRQCGAGADVLVGDHSTPYCRGCRPEAFKTQYPGIAI